MFISLFHKVIRKDFLILMILFFLSSSLVAKTSIVFRYDDYRLNNSPIDSQIVSIFKNVHIPLVLGVIPCDSLEQPYDKTSVLFKRELAENEKTGEIEIALHGLTHIAIGQVGEFAGLDFQTQVRRLRKGKLLLDSLLHSNVITFIPPWNAYDNTTLNALNKTGFQIISSALVNQSLSEDNIVYYPFTISSVNDIEKEVRKKKFLNGSIIVMIHSYDFYEKQSIQGLRSVLLKLKTDKSLEFHTFKSLKSKGYIIDRPTIHSQWHQNLLMKIIDSNTEILHIKTIYLLYILNALLHLTVSLSLFFLFRLLSKKRNITFNPAFGIWFLVVFILGFINIIPPFKLAGIIIGVQLILSSFIFFRNRVKDTNLAT